MSFLSRGSATYSQLEGGDLNETSSPGQQQPRVQMNRPSPATSRQMDRQHRPQHVPSSARHAQPFPGTVVVSCGVCFARWQIRSGCDEFQCERCGALVAHGHAEQPVLPEQQRLRHVQDADRSRGKQKEKKEKKSKKHKKKSKRRSSSSSSSSTSSGTSSSSSSSRDRRRTTRKLRKLEKQLASVQRPMGDSSPATQHLMQQGLMLMQRHSDLDRRELHLRVEEMEQRLVASQTRGAAAGPSAGGQGPSSEPWPGEHWPHSEPWPSPTTPASEPWPPSPKAAWPPQADPGHASSPSSQRLGGSALAVRAQQTDSNPFAQALASPSARSGVPLAVKDLQAGPGKKGVLQLAMSTPGHSSSFQDGHAKDTGWAGISWPAQQGSDAFPPQSVQLANVATSSSSAAMQWTANPFSGSSNQTQQSITVAVPPALASMSSDELMLLAQAKRYAESMQSKQASTF